MYHVFDDVCHTASVGTRAYYYTSVQGSEDALDQVRRELRHIRFSPQIFKKNNKNQKAKGVDVSLTKDMLCHAFNNHYEVAVLVADDGDYVPLVEEVKRYGKLVVCAFFADGGLSPALKLACDGFTDLSSIFQIRWRDHNATQPAV